MRPKRAILTVLASLFAGCGSDSAERASEPQAAEPRRETVFDPLTSTIGRAQGVQQTLDEQAAEQRRRIEDAER